jgi:hypothetical protein
MQAEELDRWLRFLFGLPADICSGHSDMQLCGFIKRIVTGKEN